MSTSRPRSIYPAYRIKYSDEVFRLIFIQNYILRYNSLHWVAENLWPSERILERMFLPLYELKSGSLECSGQLQRILSPIFSATKNLPAKGQNIIRLIALFRVSSE